MSRIRLRFEILRLYAGDMHTGTLQFLVAVARNGLDGWRVGFGSVLICCS